MGTAADMAGVNGSGASNCRYPEAYLQRLPLLRRVLKMFSGSGMRVPARGGPSGLKGNRAGTASVGSTKQLQGIGIYIAGAIGSPSPISFMYWRARFRAATYKQPLVTFA